MKKNAKHQKIKTKNQGITLISVVLISVLIITAVMGVAHVLVKELSFSADTLSGERAYFAAESAVENANLKLLENPIFDGKEAVEFKDLKNNIVAKSTAIIKNISDDFTITLTPNQQQTIRLQTSVNGDTQGLQNLPTLSVSRGATKKEIIWTLRCEESGSGSETPPTASIQGNFHQPGNQLIRWKGKLDTSKDKTKFETFSSQAKLKRVGNKFWNTSPTLIKKETCTLSLENLSGNKAEIKISGTEMAPEIGTVSATGTSNNRTKTIEYKTSQSSVNQWINWGVIGR